MINESYLEKGLTGLARCHDAPWESHFPAAVLAGFYYSAANKLPAETERKMEAQLDLLIAAKHELFPPYSSNGALADSSEPIVEALEESIDRFSELGHNAIFAAYALRALKDKPAFRSEKAVLDIASVIRQLNCEPAHYWLRIAKEHDPRSFSIDRRTVFTDDLPAEKLAGMILAELPKFTHIYTQMGSKSHVGHLLTQSQALLALRQLGFPQLANRGSYSLECRFILLKDSQGHKSSERSFYRPATRSALLPHEPEYWAQDFTQCQWDEGHAFKYTFSFHELANQVADEKVKAEATEKFRYLISPNERSKSI